MFVFTANADIFGMDITEFWNRVKNLCKLNGITQQELSEKLGYGARNLEIKILRKSIPSLEDVYNISKIFSVNYDYLIDGIGEAEKAKEKFIVPLLNKKQEAEESKKEDYGFIKIPEDLRKYGNNLVMLYIESDSMTPTLRRGDIVISDTLGYCGEDIYIIKQEETYSVKRIVKDSGKYIIISDNKIYPVKEVSVDSVNTSVIGRVHYVMKNCD